MEKMGELGVFAACLFDHLTEEMWLCRFSGEKHE
jgi:hypothetical protein